VKKARQVFNCVMCIMLLLSQLTPANVLAQEDVATSIKMYGTIDTSWYTEEEKQYFIGTEAQLRGLAVLVMEGQTFSGKTIQLEKDIILAGRGSDNNWNPIGFSPACCFSGVFDGRGHSISGIVINSTASHQGLFGYVEGAVFKSLTVSGAVSGGEYTGGIVGYAGPSTSFEDCTSRVEVSGTSYVGGIVGKAYTPKKYDDVITAGISFDDCVNKGDVTGEKYTGGIAGFLSGLVSLENCSNEGTIYGGKNTAGVAGYISGDSNGGAQLENCYNTGLIQGGSGDYVGGVVGYTNGSLGTLKDCYNTGDVTGKDTVGGVVASLGGGKQGTTTVTQCYNTGKVSSNSITGGVFGYVEDSFFDGITFCFNCGPVISNGRYIGGVAAYLAQNSRFNHCYNKGDIVSTASVVKGVGGIVGYSSFPVTSYAVNCYNAGKITSTADDFVGAITGSGYESNTDCFYDVAGIVEPADALKAIPLTAEDFARGKAAYLLDKGDKDFRTRLWSQGEDGYPIFVDGNLKSVYKITVGKCQNGKVNDSAEQQNLYITAGEDVRLAVTPEEGHILYLLTVTDKDGVKYEITIEDANNAVFTMPETDVTVTAAFVEAPPDGIYTVSFDSDGATPVKSQRIQAGKRVTSPEVPEKEGFVFDGWYLGSAKYDFIVAVLEDIKLTAHWREEENYIVAFNVNRGYGAKGSEPPTNQTVSQGNKVIEPDKPTWHSDDVTLAYQFTGWYTAGVDGEKWDFGEDEVMRDVTLYAQWEIMDTFTTGTEKAPFKIESLKVLEALAERVNRNTGDNRGYEGCYFQLAGDIALPGDWPGIGYSGGKSATVLGTSPDSDLLPFNGNFDGGGHTITLDGNQTVSLFGSVGLEGVVDNLRVEGVLESISRSSFGGIAGVNHGLIKDCTVSLKAKDEGINAVSACGGIVGANFGGIKNCSAFVEFNASGIHIGGIAGYMKGGDKYRFVENCNLLKGSSLVSNGKYGAYGGAVGGIIATMASQGVNDGLKVVDCSVEEARIAYKGDFSGATAGGVVGYAMVEVSNCKSAATVEGLDYVGGIAGQINSVAGPVLMRQCVNTGQVSGRDYVNDILGSGTAKIIDCYSIIDTDDVAPSLSKSELASSLPLTEQLKGNAEIDKNVPEVSEAKETSENLSYSDFRESKLEEPKDKKPAKVFEIVKKTVEENPLVAVLVGTVFCLIMIFSGLWRYRQYRKSF